MKINRAVVDEMCLTIGDWYEFSADSAGTPGLRLVLHDIYRAQREWKCFFVIPDPRDPLTLRTYPNWSPRPLWDVKQHVKRGELIHVPREGISGVL